MCIYTIWSMAMKIGGTYQCVYVYIIYIYIYGLCKGYIYRGYTSKIWPKIGTNVPAFLDPGIPIEKISVATGPASAMVYGTYNILYHMCGVQESST